MAGADGTQGAKETLSARPAPEKLVHARNTPVTLTGLCSESGNEGRRKAGAGTETIDEKTKKDHKLTKRILLTTEPIISIVPTGWWQSDAEKLWRRLGGVEEPSCYFRGLGW